MQIVLRSTRNIKSLFPLKKKAAHRSCIIYKGKCSCRLSYIPETKRNSEVRWKEHEDTTGKSEPAKYLIENVSRKFTWKVLSIAPSHFRRRNILEAVFIALGNPVSDDQLEHHFLKFFFVMILPKFCVVQTPIYSVIILFLSIIFKIY